MYLNLTVKIPEQLSGIPNGNYLKFFPDAELPDELPVSARSGCVKIGAWLVIKKVIEHYHL